MKAGFPKGPSKKDLLADAKGMPTTNPVVPKRISSIKKADGGGVRGIPKSSLEDAARSMSRDSGEADLKLLPQVGTPKGEYQKMPQIGTPKGEYKLLKRGGKV
jgi:hypothetical protein